MRFWAIFRFELAYQLRRAPTWFYVAVVAFFAFVQFATRSVSARNGDYFAGAPFVVASVAVISFMVWMVVTAYVTGDAAARDVSTGMHPLTYAAPVTKAEYLGGRFLAAFVLNASILLAIPAGTLLGVYGPEVEPTLRGPFLPAAYLAVYGLVVLPSAFVATAVQFAFAALSRRAIAAYLASLLLLTITRGVTLLPLRRDLLQFFDPIGAITILRNDLTVGWTQLELNTRMIALEGGPLGTRLLWVVVSLGVLAFAHARFRFGHPTPGAGWRRAAGRHVQRSAVDDAAPGRHAKVAVPRVPRTFGVATRARQTLAIAGRSFRTIAASWSWLIFAPFITLLSVALVLDGFQGVPLLPRTENVIAALITPQPGPLPWLLVPLLIIFWAGEVIWREREARVSEIADAAPVPDRVLFLGKYLGLALLPVALMVLLATVGILVQVVHGGVDVEIGQYLQALLGLQLVDYLQLALFAFGVHVVVNQKAVGQAVVLFTLFVMMIAYANEMGHELLVPIFSPSWAYTDMIGFGPSLGPWLWLKLYWVGWVLLLAVAARLLWMRGNEEGLRVRLRVARRRLSLPAAATAVGLLAIVFTTGGFIFYNTNVVNDYTTASDDAARRAEYERRFVAYRDALQPRLTETALRVEIYPDRREVQFRGTYRLVNATAAVLDTVHLATAWDALTGPVAFDRPASLARADAEVGHRIYILEDALAPGDSLRLTFAVDVALRDFSNRGADPSVSAKSTFFTNQAWLPAIGYQPNREIVNPNVRRVHGLEPGPRIPSPYDVDPTEMWAGAEWIDFEAVVGTSEDQVAVAPGMLRRTWMEGGRRYFHYATDVPIGNQWAIASSGYAVHEAQWNDVAIQIFHHPTHSENVDRMVRAVRASLEYYTGQFGPPQRSYVRLIEQPGRAFGLHAENATITYGERFSLAIPEADERGFDLFSAVVAHEVAHGWGVPYARAEGAGFLSESFAWYAALGTIESAHGRDSLRRFLEWMREPFPIAPVRDAVPLLRAHGDYLNYRRGPFTLYALAEYIGRAEVNDVFRSLLEAHPLGTERRATSLDVYRRLQEATPDSLQGLLHDLFEANTWWEFEAERAIAEPLEAGAWQVTLDIRARKEVVDTAGVETEIPLDEWVEVAVFGAAEEDGESGDILYRRLHRVRATEETIAVTVPRRPARAGIDPFHLLIDDTPDDNVVDVTEGT